MVGGMDCVDVAGVLRESEDEDCWGKGESANKR